MARTYRRIGCISPALGEGLLFISRSSLYKRIQTSIEFFLLSPAERLGSSWERAGPKAVIRGAMNQTFAIGIGGAAGQRCVATAPANISQTIRRRRPMHLNAYNAYQSIIRAGHTLR